MDWVKQLIEKHTDAEGKVNTTAFLAEVSADASKHVVPKAEFNAKNEAFKSTKADLEALQKNSGDADALQAKITEATERATKAETDFAALERSTAIDKALTAAGGLDNDYLAFKLGDVELDKLENRIKDLKNDHPNYFPAPEGGGDKGGKGGDDKGGDAGKGFRTLDNKLNDGKAPTESETMSATLDTAFGFSDES